MNYEDCKKRLVENERQLDYWMDEYTKHGDTQALEALNRAHVTLAETYDTLNAHGK